MTCNIIPKRPGAGFRIAAVVSRGVRRHFGEQVLSGEKKAACGTTGYLKIAV